MRNVRQTTATQTLKKFDSSVAGGTIPTFTTTFTRNDVRSQRSDSVGTRKLPSGGYVFSTNYDAFFSDSSTSPGECAQQESLAGVPGVWTVTYRWDGGSDRNMIDYGCAQLVPAVSTAAVSRCQQKALEKIRANDLNLGETFAQLKQTSHEVNSMARQAWLFIRGELLGHDVNRLMVTLNPREIASEWLRFQYGIKPLMSDIYAACKTIESLSSQPMGEVLSRTKDDDYSLPANTSRRTYGGSVSRGCEISYLFEIENQQAFQFWRYGLSDPLSAAWEVLTYSFVIDWFLHVGDFIAGIGKPLGLRVVDGYKTLWLSNQIEVWEQFYDDEYGTVRSGTSGRKVTRPVKALTTVKTRAMRRTVESSVSGPMPYLDLDLNPNQWLNALALFATKT